MNHTLIGMSGVGKSYVGQRLAAALSCRFIDIDVEMEREYGQPLQEILETLGEEEFLLRQEEQVLAIDFTQPVVVSPGGSVVYSDKAMAALQENSNVVYLKAPIAYIKSRVQPDSRGIVGLKDSTYEALFAQREKLYEAYAASVLDVEGKSAEAIIAKII